MKMTVFFGSPHKNGYTSLLLDFFLSFLPKSDVFSVDCYAKGVKPCIDCKKCRENYRCKFSDMDEIIAYVEESDVLILAFPIYNASFPAPMKAILDRLQPYYFARAYAQKMRKKKVILLFTCGSKLDYTGLILEQIKPILKILNAELCGYFSLSGTDSEKLDIDKFYLKSENEIRVIVSKLGDISNLK